MQHTTGMAVGLQGGWRGLLSPPRRTSGFMGCLPRAIAVSGRASEGHCAPITEDGTWWRTGRVPFFEQWPGTLCVRAGVQRMQCASQEASVSRCIWLSDTHKRPCTPTEQTYTCHMLVSCVIASCAPQIRSHGDGHSVPSLKLMLPPQYLLSP